MGEQAPNNTQIEEVGRFRKVGNAERYNNMGRVRKSGEAIMSLFSQDRADQLEADRHSATVQNIAEGAAKMTQEEQARQQVELAESTQPTIEIK